MKYINRITWRKEKLAWRLLVLLKDILIWCVLMMSPVMIFAAIVPNPNTYGLLGFGLAMAFFLGAMVLAHEFQTNGRAWWWVWIAGDRYRLNRRGPPDNGVGDFPLNRADPDLVEWLNSKPRWHYSLHGEHIVFLFREDSVYYKLAWVNV